MTESTKRTLTETLTGMIENVIPVDATKSEADILREQLTTLKEKVENAEECK